MVAATPKGPPSSFFFNSCDGSLAARPALFSARQFRRQNEHHFQLASRVNFRIRVEKDAAAAQVAGISGSLDLSIRGLDGHGNFRSYAFLGTSLEFFSFMEVGEYHSMLLWIRFEQRRSYTETRFPS